VVAIYSTFLTRAFDQTNLDVGLHHLPVVFAVDRAGITGDDGPSHHGVLDLALLTKVPGMTVFAPSSAQEVDVMLRQALAIDSGPSALRYPKGAARQVPPEEVGSGLSGRVARRGHSACVLAVGKLVEAAEEAARLLESHGVELTVWDVRVVKPLDAVMLADAAAHPLVVTAEDGIRQGGVGSAIADAVASRLLEEGRSAPPVVVLGVPDEYIAQASPSRIHADLGLDGPGIAAAVLTALGRLGGQDPVRSRTGAATQH
jgi:1-deoxy-D-xylulose-5-phosphate synthase